MIHSLARVPCGVEEHDRGTKSEPEKANTGISSPSLGRWDTRSET